MKSSEQKLNEAITELGLDVVEYLLIRKATAKRIRKATAKRANKKPIKRAKKLQQKMAEPYPPEADSAAGVYKRSHHRQSLADLEATSAIKRSILGS